MRHPKLRTLAAIVLPIVLLLAMASVASAHWIVNNPPDSWDDKQEMWQNANQVIYLDGTPQPFYYSYGLDQGGDEFDDTPFSDVGYPAACGARTTVWAGTALIGLAHTDTDNDNNAPGFITTDPAQPGSTVQHQFSLVKCSALDPKQGTPKKYPAAGDILYTCTADNLDNKIDRCEIVYQDDVSEVGCGGGGTGPCKNEIQTRLLVSLDTDCDGTLDAGFTSDVCLYWEAQKPPLVAPYWQGSLQARVQDDQGDKTITFSIAGPNAVSLQHFSASARAAGVSPLAVVLGIALVGLSGLALAWRSARG